ncbi:hypothetical protein CU103_13240 [Phyllobacterium sophorae]|jgi:hypothetical protein|uniref:Uncharacterized protein n=2 Tax=Phyllobacteriaceae TaxID=69277 RepID=A0A2P7BC62_9HYPH|nr:hypothetical protein CU103_13240 [Phyllobacterium sophorae]
MDNSRIVYQYIPERSAIFSLSFIMTHFAKYKRFTLDSYENNDAVKVFVFENGGKTVADIFWDENGQTGAGTYLYATYVPVALERAEDVRQNYGFAKVIVIIENLDLWDADWGDLID